MAARVARPGACSCWESAISRLEVMRMRASSAKMQARAMSDVTRELVEAGRVELCDALLEDFQMALDKEVTVKTPQVRPWWRRWFSR